MQITDIITAIVNGECDGHEDAVYNALSTRSKQKRAIAKLTNAVTFKVGDTVRLCGLSPKSLNGHIVKIAPTPSGRRAPKTKFFIVSDTAIGGGRIPANCPVKVPADCVEAL